MPLRGAPFIGLVPTFSEAINESPHSSFLDSMCKCSTASFHSSLGPRLTDPNSTGGAYFISAQDGTNLAVLKPEDEEPYCVNNPKGLVGGAAPESAGVDTESDILMGLDGSVDYFSDWEGEMAGAARNAEVRTRALGALSRLSHRGNPQSGWMRKGVRPGEGIYREVAAWLLDSNSPSPAGVPPTALVYARHAALHVSSQSRKIFLAHANSLASSQSEVFTLLINEASSSGAIPNTRSHSANASATSTPPLAPALIGSIPSSVGQGGPGSSSSRPFHPSISSIDISPLAQSTLSSEHSSAGLQLVSALPKVLEFIQLQRQDQGEAGSNPIAVDPTASNHHTYTPLLGMLSRSRSPSISITSPSPVRSSVPINGNSGSQAPPTPPATPAQQQLSRVLAESGEQGVAESLVDLLWPPVKCCSLQSFVPHTCSAEDVSSSLWPVEEVHKIAILDIRLSNTDRNDDNILCRARFLKTVAGAAAGGGGGDDSIGGGGGKLTGSRGEVGGIASLSQTGSGGNHSSPPLFTSGGALSDLMLTLLHTSSAHEHHAPSSSRMSSSGHSPQIPGSPLLHSSLPPTPSHRLYTSEDRERGEDTFSPSHSSGNGSRIPPFPSPSSAPPSTSAAPTTTSASSNSFSSNDSNLVGIALRVNGTSVKSRGPSSSPPASRPILPPTHVPLSLHSAGLTTPSSSSSSSSFVSSPPNHSQTTSYSARGGFDSGESDAKSNTALGGSLASSPRAATYIPPYRRSALLGPSSTPDGFKQQHSLDLAAAASSLSLNPNETSPTSEKMSSQRGESVLAPRTFYSLRGMNSEGALIEESDGGHKCSLSLAKLTTFGVGAESERILDCVGMEAPSSPTALSLLQSEGGRFPGKNSLALDGTKTESGTTASAHGPNFSPHAALFPVMELPPVLKPSSFPSVNSPAPIAATSINSTSSSPYASSMGSSFTNSPSYSFTSESCWRKGEAGPATPLALASRKFSACGTLLAGGKDAEDVDVKLLRSADRLELVPIDHGLCLPSVSHLSDISFSWIHWNQCKEPLSPTSLAHIASLNASKDSILLWRVLGPHISPSSHLTLRLTTALLQEGALAGLTLREIGKMMIRGGIGRLDEPAPHSTPSSSAPKPPPLSPRASMLLPAFSESSGSSLTPLSAATSSLLVSSMDRGAAQSTTSSPILSSHSIRVEEKRRRKREKRERQEKRSKQRQRGEKQQDFGGGSGAPSILDAAPRALPASALEQCIKKARGIVSKARKRASVSGGRGVTQDTSQGGNGGAIVADNPQTLSNSSISSAYGECTFLAFHDTVEKVFREIVRLHIAAVIRRRTQ